MFQKLLVCLVLIICVWGSTLHGKILNKAICEFLESNEPEEIYAQFFKQGEFQYPTDINCFEDYPSIEDISGTTAEKWIESGKIVVGTDGGTLWNCSEVDENGLFECGFYEAHIVKSLIGFISRFYEREIEVFFRHQTWFTNKTCNILYNLNQYDYDIASAHMTGTNTATWIDSNGKEVVRVDLIDFSYPYQTNYGVAMRTHRALPQNLTGYNISKLEDLNVEGIIVGALERGTEITYCRNNFPKAQCMEYVAMSVEKVIRSAEYHAVLTSSSLIFWNDEFEELEGKWFSNGPVCFALRKTDDLESESGNNYLFLAVLIPSVFVVLLILASLSFVGAVVLAFLIIKQKNQNKTLEQKELEIAKISMGKIKINKSVFTVEAKEIDLIEAIGSGGSCSTIYKAKFRGNIVAYKSFTVRTLSNQVLYDEFERECEILLSLRHPNCVQCFGVVMEEYKVGLILEYAKNGDLENYLLQNKVSKEKKYQILLELIDVIDFLHNKDIIHRDLKPKNILMTTKEDGKTTIKVIDFGISKIVQSDDETLTTKIGTSFFASPQVSLGHKYGKKTDIWSFAFVSYIVFTNNFHPFGKGKQIGVSIATDENKRPEIDEKDFEGFEFLIPVIQKCWSHKEEDRYSSSELMDIFQKRSLPH